MTTRLRLLALFVGVACLSACGAQEPVRPTIARAVWAATPPPEALPTPENPFKSVPDLSGEWTTMEERPKPKSDYTCGQVDANGGHPWTLYQEGVVFRGSKLENANVLHKAMGSSETFTGKLVGTKLTLDGTEEGTRWYYKRPRPVHYVLTYNAKGGYLEGTRNGEPFYAATCHHLFMPGRQIQPLPPDGMGRRNPK